MLIPFFAGLILIAGLDQLMKYFAVMHLTKLNTIPLIADVFHLTYCENPGAGFGIFADYTWLLSIFTAAVVFAVVVCVVIKRPKHPALITALTFMTGGAVGNLIDRVRLGYVVDFLDFRLINFPIFNVADCFVTVGAVILAVYIIFFSEKDGAKKEQTDENHKSGARR